MKSHKCLAYADNITHFARSERELQQVIRKLLKEAKWVGTSINLEKTKYMKIGESNYDKAHRQLLSFTTDENNIEFEKVKTFVFLGVRVLEDCDKSQEIEAGLSKGDMCIAELRSKN